MPDTMERKIQFAVVGHGHIGKRHAEMVARHPECELVAICDVRSAGETGGTALNVPWFADLGSLLREVPTVEVVNICTPNGLHARQAIQALEAGKHVVCEKPMALSRADGEAMLHAALQAHRMVFGVMQNRWSPPSQWLKGVLDQGLLGSIHMVQVNCWWNRDARYYVPGGWKGTAEMDGGTLFTQFSHFVDMLYWLFGDISDIQGRFADFNHQGLTAFEDSGLVTFNFRKGGMGCISYSTAVWDRNLESSLTVIGAKGSVKIGGQYMDKVEHCHIQDLVMPELPATNPANDYGAYQGSANNHGQVMDNVVDTLRGRNAPTTNALEGLKVVEIIERIYRKRDEQRHV
jgi:UDP-N-acetyl-2-amino-2-deoxyglucuronate dehydrogenase